MSKILKKSITRVYESVSRLEAIGLVVGKPSGYSRAGFLMKEYKLTTKGTTLCKFLEDSK